MDPSLESSLLFLFGSGNFGYTFPVIKNATGRYEISRMNFSVGSWTHTIQLARNAVENQNASAPSMLDVSTCVRLCFVKCCGKFENERRDY